MASVKSCGFIAAGFFLLLSQSARAVPPLFPEAGLSKMKTCFLNTEENKRRSSMMKKFAPGFAPPIAATTYRVAVIRVDFSDKTMTKTLSQSSTFFTAVKDFYLENSYNIMTVTATLTDGGAGAQGSYRMPRTYATYANGISSNYSLLAQDAVAVATTAGFNFSSFDHIMIYHAGEGSETASSAAQQSANIWSVYAPANVLGGPVASGKTFPGATFVPEKEYQSVDPLGVICHEYGHQLGLPDLYETTSLSAVGRWSLMDAGVYLPNPAQSGVAIGANPAHMDAWSKQFLGFSAPETVSSNQAVTKILSPAETSRTSFLRIPISVSDVGSDNEYFLLEYRRTTGATYDNFLPGQGLLIWHIDDSIASSAARLAQNNINALSSRRGVELVQADSSDPSTNGGDSSDPWPGSTILFKSPDSNAYNGTASGIEISNITGAGNASMSMSINSPYSNPAITSNNVPNSVIVTGGANGYTNPSLNETALIGLRPSQSGRIELKVYTLSGTLVWETTATGSANQQTLVNWDGKNSDGNTVTSGIYLVHVSGGGIDAKKKVAILK